MRLFNMGDSPILAKGPERFYQFLLALLWCEDGVISYFIGFLHKFPRVGQFADYIFPFFIVIFCLASLKYLIRANTIGTISVYIGSLLLVLCTLLFGSEVSIRRIDLMFPYMMTALPYVLVGCGLNYKRDFKLLTILSWLNIIFTIIYQFYYMGTNRVLSEEQMGMAYSVLPSIIISFLFAFQKKQLFSLLCGILGAFLLLAGGCRGAIVCLLTFLLLYVLLYSLKDKKKRIKTIILLCGVVVIVFVSLTNFFKFTSQLGFGNRIYSQISGQEEMNGSGRENMHKISIQQIFNGPALGRGVMGEANIYVPAIGVETYPHNIILELLLQFGIIFGGILVFIVLYLPYHFYRKQLLYGDRNAAMFIVAWFSFVYMNLMFSYTFWTTPWFFFLLGYCMKGQKPLLRS